MSGPLLKPGVHAWVWPTPGDLDSLARTADKAVRLGIVGLIPQDGLGIPSWLTRNRGRVQRIMQERGLQLTVGLGMDGNQGWKNNLGALVDAIVGGLDAAPGVMLNWESKWGDERADKERADFVANEVLKRHPTADNRCVDAPWWAPLFVWRTLNGKRRKAYTHPGAPTVEFGRLCKGDRFPQVYGANVPGSPDGASQRMLDWSKDPSQYPALGVNADRIRPSLQAYKRTVTDHVRMLVGHPTVCLWHFRGMDADCEAALAFVQAIRAKGYTGPGADVRFQTDQGIKGPEWMGPKALRAAGVPVRGNLTYRRGPVTGR